MGAGRRRTAPFSLETVVGGKLNDPRIVIHRTDLSEGRVVDVEVGGGGAHYSVISGRRWRDIEGGMVHPVDQVGADIHAMTLTDREGFLDRHVPLPLPWTSEHAALQVAHVARYRVEEHLAGE